MLISVKGKVGCSPFTDQSVRSSSAGAAGKRVVRIENMVTLTPLRVVLASEEGRFSVGDTVYVSSRLYTHPWAKEEHEIDGVKFILVPETAIEAFQKGTNYV